MQFAGRTRIYFGIEKDVIIYKQEFLDKKDGRTFRTVSPLSSETTNEAFLRLLLERYRQGY
jgi:hypothetical protein